jgi:hypothetical protein
MTWTLGHLTEGITAWTDATAFGLAAAGPWDLADRTQWPAEALATPMGYQVSLEVEALLEAGLAKATDQGIAVPWHHWEELIKLGLELPRHWLPWSPFLLHIESISSVGREDFEYRYQYLLGTREVLVHRLGGVVERAHHPGRYLLDPQSLALVEAMDHFNGLSPEERKSPDAWIRFSEIKGCAKNVGAQLEEYLTANEVVVPAKIGLTVVERPDGTVHFFPRCEGVPHDAFERAFHRSKEDQTLFHFDGEDGRKIRLVLPRPQREALQRMKRVQGLKGARAERLRRQPHEAFEGLLEQIEVAYSRRVEGIGDWRPNPLPKSSSGVSLLEIDGLELGNDWDPEAEAEALGFELFKIPVSVEIANPDTGEPQRLHLESQPEARAFIQAMETAEHLGEAQFGFQGRRWPVDAELKESLRRGGGEDGGTKTKKYLLIYTDEEDVQPRDLADVQGAVAAPCGAALTLYEAPACLAPAFPLKPHQEEAVAWLQQVARLSPSRRGGLLADEMGLGKTLEVLTFLAWCRERGLFEGLAKNLDVYRPVLVIAPLMLVEIETWQADMAKFFQPGAFGPVLSLHGSSLQRFRSARGRETEVGAPLLDLDELLRYQVVITNYETVTNFQHSFAQMRNGKSIWSVVITDEAQEFKNPQARISHAIKALHPDFHIACTGTPVENRLLDIWNLFDAIQPSLLGTAKSFRDAYEATGGANIEPTALGNLRDRLLYQQPQAFLLRREKTILPGFPAKTEVPLRCPMTVQEVDRHIRLLKALQQSKARKGLHLAYLHRIVELYQHPLAYREDFESIPVPELIAASPKLQQVLQRVNEIKAKDEKVLLFARHIKIQHMLSRVLSETHGLRVSVINGEAPGKAEEAAHERSSLGRQQRVRTLERFKAHPGFNVLVLSPFVAGVGLTITEANHVIHFGRWWNPAVEAQATDRVYRIGQQKDVEVHLPMLVDETGRLPSSFDERLHQLLDAKRNLARDFLAPRQAEEDLAKELCDLLVQDLDDQKEATASLAHEDLASLPRPLVEAFVALVLERVGYSVELGDPKLSGGVTLVARRGAELLLLKCSWSRERDRCEADAAALVSLDWRPRPNERILVFPLNSQSPDLPSNGISVWSLSDLWKRAETSITDLDLMTRDEHRVPIRPAP